MITREELQAQGTQASVLMPQTLCDCEGGGGMTAEEKAALEAQLDKKVDKENGKALSTNDFTNELKQKLDSLSNYNDTELRHAIEELTANFNSLVNSNPTKAIENFKEIIAFLDGIEDSTTLDGIIAGIEVQIANINKALSDYATKTEVDKKVDKVTGKQLSTEDFTTILKQKLDGLTNYDDTELTKQIDELKKRLDVLVGSDDVTAVIDTFQEIENFLAGITNKETLTGLLADLKSEIASLCADTYVSLNKNEEIRGIKTFKDSPYVHNKNPRVYLKEDDSDGSIVNRGHFGANHIGVYFYNGISEKHLFIDNEGNLLFTPYKKVFTEENYRSLLYNGTSSQFLKADGSIDNTAYLPNTNGIHKGNITVEATVDGGIVIKPIKPSGAQYVGLLYKNATDNTNIGGIGLYTNSTKNEDGSYTNSIKGFSIGWGNDPWNTYHSFYVNDEILAYKGDKVWHEGNFNPTNYLPLSGGDIKGKSLSIKQNDQPVGGSAINYYTKDKDGNIIGGFGEVQGDNTHRFHYVGWGDEPWNSDTNLAISDTIFTYKNNKVWHEGNDGADSGLDADLLDGKHDGELTANTLDRHQFIQEGSDLNDIEHNGFKYYYGFSAVNSPYTEAFSNALFDIQRHASGSSSQIFINGNEQMFFRSYISFSETWTKWREFAFTDTTIGRSYAIKGYFDASIHKFPLEYEINYRANIQRREEDLFPANDNANGILYLSRHKAGTERSYHSQLGFSGNGNLYYRLYDTNGNIHYDWNEIAFTSSNVASADKLTTKQLTNEDLDDISVSNFRTYYGEGGNSVKNKPEGIDAFGLQVIKTGSTVSSQILTAGNGPNAGVVFKRYFDINTKTWSEWKRMLTENDITTLIARIEALEAITGISND